MTISCRIKLFAATAVSGLVLGLTGMGNAIAAGPGSDTCVKCHEDEVASYAKSVHGQKGNARGPSNAGECSSCHGDATEHVAKRGKVPLKTPGKKNVSADESNGACVSCHKQQRAELNRPSRHPILEGKVACSDCHNVHGSVGPKLMKKDSTVETCYQCHAEKRGPFVHNHEPVQEDCGNCHNPHGTVADSLLKMRQPFLCHACHTPHGGQVLQVTGQGNNNRTATSGGKDGVNITQGRGCLNCHTQVHGGNNPNATNPPAQFMLR